MISALFNLWKEEWEEMALLRLLLVVLLLVKKVVKSAARTLQLALSGS